MKRTLPTLPQILLMLLPVVALGIWGLWTQKQAPVKIEPFRLVISEVQITTLPKSPFTNPDPKARGVQAQIWIGHRGEAPAWWGEDVNPANPRVVFLAPKQKDDGGNNGNYSGTEYDKKRNQYSLVFKGEIPRTPLFLETSTCLIESGLETQMQPPKPLASIRTSIPTRQLLQPNTEQP